MIRRTSCIRDVSFGPGAIVVEPGNLYECSLGRDVFVGPFVEIQRGVVVGDFTRIQSHAFLCEGVSLGAYCCVGHGVMFTNDRFALGHPSRVPTEWEKTTIGSFVSIGSNSTLLPVSICDYVVIGAGSVVTKDIQSPGTYAGNPARQLRAFSPDECHEIRLKTETRST